MNFHRMKNHRKKIKRFMAANAKWKLGEESAIETTEIIKIKAATVKSCM